MKIRNANSGAQGNPPLEGDPPRDPDVRPIKDPNPPDASEVDPPRETPKVGSRDAPGG